MKKQKLASAFAALALALTSTMVQAAEYKASSEEKTLKITNLSSLEAQVKARMDKGAFGYIRGGAEDENNLRSNTADFDKKYIMPRVLQGIELKDINLSTSLLGIGLKTPIIQAPMAAQGLAHQNGELATAKGMAQVGSIFSLSTYGNKTIAEVAEASGENPFFFQLYMSKNNQFNEFILGEAVKHGAKAIILTVDSPVGGYREDDIKNNFQFPLGFANLEMFAQQNDDGSKTGKGAGISEIYAQAKQAFTPEDIQYVHRISGLPVIVKGIQSPEDAEVAIQAGAAGLWVSNHGGRQLDSGPSSFDLLPAIAKAVNKRVPIIFDSGVRRGSHVFKALASGADIVAVGRPVLYGLNLGGAQGVASVIEQLNKELVINMMLGGAKDIEQVKKTKLLTEKDLQP
jgi:isopentenyl diphosphate isomerase/L-lactate dehydrogenase-like FMN-dependent dehydrogenase